jgi:hypothetical protein
MNIYYVYAYLRKDGTPYYIGKGNRGRAWQKHRNVQTPAESNHIVIVENNLTEIGALAMERRLIRWYGRQIDGSGILLNKTEGGNGCLGVKTKGRVPWNKGKKMKSMTDEHRQKISRALKGRKKSPEHRKKVSDSRQGGIPWNKDKPGSQVAWNKGVANPTIQGDANPSRRPEVKELLRQKALERWARKKAALAAACSM